MSVNSKENKGLLWQLLSNHPNQKNNPKKFQSVLEYRVNEMHQHRFKFKDLMSMNKEIIKQFSKEIKAPAPARANARALANARAPANASAPATASKELAKAHRAQVFETKLKDQQDNFNTLINKQKPAEIDFSDNTDESPIDARMVDNTLQERELELKKIMAQYKPNENSAKEWLSGEKTNITIDKNSNINIEPVVKEVRFAEPQTSTSFLQKLKKNDGVLSHLIRIETKQDKIISLLEKIAGK